LIGDYASAKKVFRECLKLDPSAEIKGPLLNNLALAYYWQKFRVYDETERVKLYEQTEESVVQKEVETIIPLLKSSIKSLESTHSSQKTMRSIPTLPTGSLSTSFVIQKLRASLM
jgi:hypothetical protein